MTDEEIIQKLLEVVSDEDKKYIVNCEGQGLHHSLGTFIRNTFNLWERPWKPEMKEMYGVLCDCSPEHPDAISSLIIEKFYQKLLELK